MGKGWEGIAASEDYDGLGSCQAHYVCVSPQEDRGGTKGAVGEGESCEEAGGLGPAEPITRIVLHNCPPEEYRQLCCLWPMPSVKACALVHSFEEPTLPASKGWLVRPPR